MSSTSTLRQWRTLDAEHVAPRDRVRPVTVASPVQLDRHGCPPSRRSPPRAFWVAARSLARETPSDQPPTSSRTLAALEQRRASAKPIGAVAAVRTATARQVDPYNVGFTGKQAQRWRRQWNEKVTDSRSTSGGLARWVDHAPSPPCPVLPPTPISPILTAAVHAPVWMGAPAPALHPRSGTIGSPSPCRLPTTTPVRIQQISLAKKWIQPRNMTPLLYGNGEQSAAPCWTAPGLA